MYVNAFFFNPCQWHVDLWDEHVRLSDRPALWSWCDPACWLGEKHQQLLEWPASCAAKTTKHCLQTFQQNSFVTAMFIDIIDFCRCIPLAVELILLHGHKINIRQQSLSVPFSSTVRWLCQNYVVKLQMSGTLKPVVLQITTKPLMMASFGRLWWTDLFYQSPLKSTVLFQFEWPTS